MVLDCGRQPGFGGNHRGQWRRCVETVADRRLVDRVAADQRRQPPHQVLEFADIARPAVALDGVERTRVEGLARQPIGGGAVEEVPRQRRDVVDARPQRRQAQRHDVQPVEQVFAKPPGIDQAAQVLVGRRDDADVGALDPRAADRGEVARLEDAEQPGLRVQRHVADLVEEQCPALRLLEPPRRPRRGPGERAALVAEQLALDQLARDRRHVDRNERRAPPRPHVVDRARDQFLAGPAFAEDHHR